MIDIDLYNVINKYNNSILEAYSNDGKVMINYFIRSKFDIYYINNISLNDLWKNKDLMKKAIVSCFDKKYQLINDNIILNEMILISNYKLPDILSFWHIILRIKKYVNKGEIFFDPCAGYGERLLAAYLLGLKYIAIDANKKLVEELQELSSFLNYDAEIYYGNSADKDFVNKIINGRKIDFCFTCIPYYNNIHYSDDDFQFDSFCHSFVEWKNNFFISIIKNCESLIKSDGKFIISMPIEFNLSEIENINIKSMMYFGFNEKMENPYYLIDHNNIILNKDYVRCKICGECMNHLTNHITKIHNMSIDEYKNKYDDKIISDNCLNNKIMANKIKYINRGDNHHYNKRYVYLLPDGTYASKSDQYKKAWGFDIVKEEHIIDASTVNYIPNYNKEINGIEGDDYVVCKICGEKKGSLTQHIRKVHNMSKDEYIKTYNVPVYSNKNKEAFHNCSLNKWKTQFDNGTSKRAEKKEKVIKIEITSDMINDLLLKGFNQIEMCNKFNCSDVTLRKLMKTYDIKMPDQYIIAIRKSVNNGSELNLELFNIIQVKNMLSEIGKEKTMKRFGVTRSTFDKWMSIHKNDKINLINMNNEEIINYFKNNGFPYPKTIDYDINKIINIIKNNKNMIDENGFIGVGAPAGNDFLLTFFPNFFDVYQDGNKSAKYYFYNKLDHIINDIKLYSHKEPNISLIRSYLMEHERISGFRPVIAKQIYDKYLNDNSIILDPCGGWGGRMLGAYCSDKVIRYDCMDASFETYKGLNNLKIFMNNIINYKEINVSFGSYEDSKFNNDFYDAIFTSPPYFCKEHYSEDDTQSCNRYKTYEEWKNNFLNELINKSYDYLKDNGLFIINIDDVKIKKNLYKLTDDFLFLSKDKFDLQDILYMKYRNRYNNHLHGEPIYILKKK